MLKEILKLRNKFLKLKKITKYTQYIFKFSFRDVFKLFSNCYLAINRISHKKPC